MINLVGIRSSSIVGLSLEGNHLEVAHVGSARGKTQCFHHSEAVLSTDLLTGDPEIGAKELKRCLNSLGIRERRCLLSLPLARLFSLQTEAPDLSEADLKSYFETQAERELPMSLDELVIGWTKGDVGGGESCASILAIPRTLQAHLERLFTQAGLQLLSVSPSFACLSPKIMGSDDSAFLLWFRRGQAELALRTRQTSVMFRSIDCAYGDDDGSAEAIARTLAREMRITFGQLPAGFRKRLKQLVFLGSSEMAESMRQALPPYLGFADLEVGVVNDPPAPARELAVAYLRGGKPPIELLAPKESFWKPWSGTLARRRPLVVTTATAVALILLIGAFIWQGRRLSRLESQWDGMADAVAEVEALQNRIKQFRPWFNESVPSLRVARLITESFPEEGAVWVRRLEIRGQSEVACSGFAEDNEILFATFDTLSASDQVDGLKVQQVRGEKTLQFSFTFNWRPQVQ